MSLSREQRAEVLRDAGIEVNTIANILDLVEQEVEIDLNDVQLELMEEIIENGYVRNTKLHRRWVMAQTFRMRNQGWTSSVMRLPYSYQFSMMLEEVRVLSKLEKLNDECFLERKNFFTNKVVCAVCNKYVEDLCNYIESCPMHRDINHIYRTVNGRTLLVDDIETDVLQFYRRNIELMKVANTYDNLYGILKRFKDGMIKIRNKTALSSEWMIAFGEAGAFYTLKNMVMYHGCKLFKNGNEYKKIDAIEYMRSLMVPMTGLETTATFMNLLDDCIEYNNFKFGGVS